jgi:hypothetical protein
LDVFSTGLIITGGQLEEVDNKSP